MAIEKDGDFNAATVTKVRDDGASCDVKFPDGFNPPRSAVPVGTLRLLSDGGGAVLLHAAAAHGARATLEELLTRGQIPVCAAALGTCRGALHFAVEHGRAKCVEVLLSHGAVATYPDAGGTTALALAKAGNEPVVVALVAPLPGDLDVRAELRGGGGSTGIRTLPSARVAPLDARPCGGAGGMTVEMWAAWDGDAAALASLSPGALEARSRSGWTPLHFAAGAGRAAIVSALLNASAAVDVVGTTGETPLWAAARNGHTATVAALLVGGAVPSRDCGTGRGTALCAAAEWGWVDVVTTLLGAGVGGSGSGGGGGGGGGDAEAGLAAVGGLGRATVRGGEGTGRAGATALVLASAEGHAAVARALLGVGARASSEVEDKETAELEALVAHRTEDGTTALLAASRAGHVEVVRELLTTGRAGTEVGAVKYSVCDGATALFVACVGGHTAVVEALLEAGADLEARLTSGVLKGATVLYTASRHGHAATVAVVLAAAQRRLGHEDEFRAFLDAGVTGGPFEGATALIDACGPGSHGGDPTGVVRQLLDAGADPHAAITSWALRGYGALHAACNHGHAREVVEMLLDAGIPVDVPVTNWLFRGATPLMWVAGSSGRVDLAELLLERGADVDAPSTGGPFWGVTPLMAASLKGHTPLVRRLLDAGARVRARHWLGGTAVYPLPFVQAHDDAAALLRASGAESVWRVRARVLLRLVLFSPFLLVELASRVCARVPFVAVAWIVVQGTDDPPVFLFVVFVLRCLSC
jgi:ankyrin repeat protein